MNNRLKPVLSVEHASLRRFSETSAFKSCCPSCEDGVLPVRRETATFRPLRRDMCLNCMQRFLYTDVTLVNEMFYVPPEKVS